jgi:hypothetical protein
MVLVREDIGKSEKKQDSGLLASVRRMQVSRPDSFNWKEDCARAQEEKYENIH